MQMSVPELIDVSSESETTLEMYGPQCTQVGKYAYNCYARRLAERGFALSNSIIVVGLT